MSTQEQGSLINACPECGEAINVSDQAPYAKIECPHCKNSIRVRTMLGQYHIQRLLGEGGMSQVFLAKDETLGRSVALKVLHKELSRDEKLTASFEREAKLTASINHPNVVKVYTVGSDHGYFFIAMELVDNLSLEEMICNDDRVPQLKVVQIAHDVTSGLEAAFKAGLIHRDIKPGNILLTNDGRAKLVDFGLAVQTGHHDADEDVWATPFYVPPEKLAGEPDDFRGDIYSLGATLFHAVSGTPPYAANTASLDELKEIKAKTIRLIDTAPDARQHTCQLIDRMMARKPAGRHQSYKELLSEIISVEKRLGGRRRSSSTLSNHAEEGSESPVWLKPAIGIAVAAVLAVLASFAFKGGDGEEVLNEALLSGNNDRVLVAGEQSKATIYLEARALLAEGKYKQAQKLFSDILKSKDLKQATLTWAKFNLGLSFLFQGQEKKSRVIFQQLQQSGTQQKTGDESEALLNYFATIGAVLNEPLPVINEASSAKGAGPAYEGISSLAFALKNWNQGHFASAARFFDQFQATSFPEPYTWIESLKKQVQSYSLDARLVKGLPRPVLSMNSGQLAKAHKQLVAAKAKLKNKGAAVRLVDQRIERIQSLLEEQKRLAALPKEKAPLVAKDPQPNDMAARPTKPGMDNGASSQAANVKRKVAPKDSEALQKVWAAESVAQGLGSNFEFPQAMSRFDMLKVEGALPRAILADEMAIVTGAESFLKVLINKLDEGEYEGAVIRKEGQPLQARVIGASRKALVIDLGFGGNQVALEEFSPAWLLTVAHQVLADSANQNPQLLSDALCFAWATGEHETAKKMAKQKTDYPEDFQNMWKRLMQNRPQ